MKMRERPVRGKTYQILSLGEEVIALEPLENMVNVIRNTGRTDTIPKNDLSLSIIDTKDYEKVT